MEESVLHTLFNTVDIASIYNDEKQNYKNQNQKIKNIDYLLSKLDILFNYALENDNSLFTISDNELKKWSKPLIHIIIEDKLKGLFSNYKKSRYIIKRTYAPLSRLIEISDIEKLNQDDYSDDFIELLRKKFNEIELSVSFENLRQPMDAASYVDKLYNKYKNNNELKMSNLISLEDVKDENLESVLNEFINKKSKLENDLTINEFKKEISNNLKYIYISNSDGSEFLESNIRNYIQKMIKNFITKRDIPQANFNPPKKEGDPIISLIVQKIKNVDSKMIKEWQEIHSLFMNAENLNGLLLELFLADVLEDNEWIWCSGEVYRSVDFCKIVNNDITLLQIKNKYNSENSSSNKVRKNTQILKWHRLKKETDNWEELNNLLDNQYTDKLNEKAYSEYINRFFEENF